MAKRHKTGGRQKGTPNRATREITDLAKALVPAAIKELGRLLKEAESETAKLKAVEIVFERAYGKPSQSIQHGGAIGSFDPTALTDEQIRNLERILGPIAAGAGDAEGDQGGEGEA